MSCKPHGYWLAEAKIFLGAFLVVKIGVNNAAFLTEKYGLFCMYSLVKFS